MAPATNNTSSISTRNDITSTSLNSVSTIPVKKANLKPKSKWKILADAIIKNRATEYQANPKNDSEDNLTPQDKDISQILRFPSYELIECTKLDNFKSGHLHTPSVIDRGCTRGDPDEVRRTWYQIFARGHEIDIKISCLNPVFSIEEITGFNNTGNVCIWPAEECLSIFCLENRHMFKGKSIIELGAGMTGLAGLIVAQACQAQKVTLTDGNRVSVRNLDTILQQNRFSAETNCHVLKWGDIHQEVLPEKFDIAICADCLFFDEGRPQLVKCLKEVLKPNGGVAFIVAPRRSGTLDHFVKLIEDEADSFSIKSEIQYSDMIWKRRQQLINSSGDDFDENVHYPVLLRCERR